MDGFDLVVTGFGKVPGLHPGLADGGLSGLYVLQCEDNHHLLFVKIDEL